MKQYIEVEIDGTVYEMVPNFKNCVKIESYINKTLFEYITSIQDGYIPKLDELKSIFSCSIDGIQNSELENYLFNNRIEATQLSTKFIAECLTGPSMDKLGDGKKKY